MDRFNNQINDCHVSDLGFKGPRFTWKGPQNFSGGGLFERLDRALASLNFLNAFPDSIVNVLPCTKFSDHNSLILLLSELPVSKSSKPFRFEAMWLEHETFKDFLIDAWKQSDDLNNTLNDLKDSIIVWNRDVFGFIEKRKRQILARLNGIQKSDAYPSRFVCNLEIKPQNELEEVLKLEEMK
ncbi:uncharacterized protein LOC114733630 [Neltuma alba]|uniref:uncharacterized protein LOC114733630 n=1 Tax=Neltuma alba TaxID=207710 RepID=UPI0010A3518C|nr:uncharacterized protein LOC114733630 [Prosopis alba]